MPIYNRDYVYRELALQEAATAWLEDTLGYRERLEDQGATGERVDSVGFIDDQPVLVEYKTAVDRRIVLYDPDRSGSIEAKIAAALRALYHETDSKIARALDGWDRRTAPLFMLIANRYSEAAIGELQNMLTQRAAEWSFDFKVLRWDGATGQTIFEGKPSEAWSIAPVPALIGTAPKRAIASMGDLEAMAEAVGVSALFKHFVARWTAAGGGLKRNVASATLVFRGSKETGSRGGLYPKASSGDAGLNVGFYGEVLDQEEDSLPGKEAPRAGFFNSNRYLSTDDEIDRMIDILTFDR